jgi:hypothetical protein
MTHIHIYDHRKPRRRGGDKRRDKIFNIPSQVYQQGRRARATGVRRMANPWPTGSQNWAEWDEGWLENWRGGDAAEGSIDYRGHKIVVRPLKIGTTYEVYYGNQFLLRATSEQEAKREVDKSIEMKITSEKGPVPLSKRSAIHKGRFGLV